MNKPQLEALEKVLTSLLDIHYDSEDCQFIQTVIFKKKLGTTFRELRSYFSDNIFDIHLFHKEIQKEEPKLDEHIKYMINIVHKYSSNVLQGYETVLKGTKQEDQYDLN